MTVDRPAAAVFLGLWQVICLKNQPLNRPGDGVGCDGIQGYFSNWSKNSRIWLCEVMSGRIFRSPILANWKRRLWRPIFLTGRSDICLVVIRVRKGGIRSVLLWHRIDPARKAGFGMSPRSSRRKRHSNLFIREDSISLNWFIPHNYLIMQHSHFFVTGGAGFIGNNFIHYFSKTLSRKLSVRAGTKLATYEEVYC